MSLETSGRPAQKRATAVAMDFLERAGWSAGQVFFATLLGGSAVTVVNLQWGHAGLLALSTAVASLVLTFIQYVGQLQDLSRTRLSPAAIFWADMGFRLVKTFLAALAGFIAAEKVFNIMTFDWPTALDAAALATLAALSKGLLARGSDTGGADTDPKATTARNPSTLPTNTYARATTGNVAEPTTPMVAMPRG